MSESDYSFGNQETTRAEQRAEIRASGRTRVWVEVAASGPGSDSTAQWLEGTGKDLSPGGLQVDLTAPISEGALLTIQVDFPLPEGERQRIPLMAEVIWCHEDAGGLYRAGLKVLESEEPAFQEWLEMVAASLEE